MKKSLLFSVAAILFASMVNAQISKGSVFIGGQISGFSSKNNNGSVTQKQSNFYISPAVGIAIKQNLIAGIDVTYSRSINDYGSGGNPVNTYGGGIFLRKYVPLSMRFNFFIQGRLGYSYDKRENGSGTNYTVAKTNNVGLSIYPGVAFALTKTLYVEAGFNNMALLSYYHYSYNQPNIPAPVKNTSSNFTYNTSVSNTNFSFGLRFIIPKK